jgi:hypothetical protein
MSHLSVVTRLLVVLVVMTIRPLARLVTPAVSCDDVYDQASMRVHAA